VWDGPTPSSLSASDGDLSDHDVADPADAGASVVANGTPTQVRQRDHLIADGPADGDLVAQRGSQPPVIRWRTLIRVRHSVPCPASLRPWWIHACWPSTVVTDRVTRDGLPTEGGWRVW